MIAAGITFPDVVAERLGLEYTTVGPHQQLLYGDDRNLEKSLREKKTMEIWAETCQATSF